ncbi:hypothetical protein CleRT_08430 [Candidatus Coxiella mudrowiae]|uniref:Membrane associated protein n=1 Tax=Candidatus Coxiella mudrowiae TaxID=2054173 RepID=A0ABN4HQW6_9COXI|nr:hypothetical protein CleRT_08430 [Candidatus Coxiella mudrowiae]
MILLGLCRSTYTRESTSKSAKKRIGWQKDFVDALRYRMEHDFFNNLIPQFKRSFFMRELIIHCVVAISIGFKVALLALFLTKHGFLLNHRWVLFVFCFLLTLWLTNLLSRISKYFLDR